MGRRLAERWSVSNDDCVRETSRASDVALRLGGMSKVLRMAIQSRMLALGAYLVIIDQATGGLMIASSILGARWLRSSSPSATGRASSRRESPRGG